MLGKITLGAAITGGMLLHYGARVAARTLMGRGDHFLRSARVDQIDVEGEKVTALVVSIPERVSSMLPLMAPKNRPGLRKYARALNTLYFGGQLNEGGVYAIEIKDPGSLFRTADYVLYALFPIQKSEEMTSEVPAEELVEKPES